MLLLLLSLAILRLGVVDRLSSKGHCIALVRVGAMMIDCGTDIGAPGDFLVLARSRHLIRDRNENLRFFLLFSSIITWEFNTKS